VAAGAELLLFVGGDGTARDVLTALGETVPVLGVPAGVKMHSAVFATGPRAAGDVALWMLGTGDADRWLTSAEVMDREPAPDGTDPPSPRLYGTLRVPVVPRLVQRAKATASLGDDVELEAACHRVAGLARDGVTTVLGPGSTLLRIKRRLGIEGTLLGADVVRGDELLARDAGEQEILDCLGPAPAPARVVVTVVGGQGFLFGRGNQQIGPRVLRRVGRDGIVVVAALEKLATLPAGGLLVDTGDETLDRELAGYLPVITGGARQAMCRVLPASP
jgi:predicted polyphosphate/ATP-dependent NAD kinase